ncbi:MULTISPECIES: DUF4437 domain-containing protein [Methylomonas]|jgi:hypothetical protein|uniref:DUF4437 domain-containing protein n=1 Tax=Methylomonas methanica TaxID=421 RepID=A0A177MRP6_METMH|nr:MULTISPECIES: DUF4437 domain-containing protein [Methylomonas]NOV30701.1 DUF4437 domain-containing protein [Methylomonas sp. ZR1]OAI07236.1 hypothetical protein A1353_07735 [Methylomonas methanica]OAI08331.1 hypothetical protein A1332_07535 [Methylomonas methanica]
MKNNMVMVIALIALAFVAVSKAKAEEVFPPTKGGKSISIPSSELKFQSTGLKGEDGSEILVVDGYGDQKDSAHGTFMKFSYGFKSPAHSYTYDYYGVVIKDEMENYSPNKELVKMGPGSYWYQRGLEAHITECLSNDGCIAWVVQSQKFDAQIPPMTE